MYSPYDAQVKQLQFNSQQAKRQAGDVMTTADRNVRDYTQQSNTLLGQTVTMLAKTGNLGYEKNSPIDTGIDVGEEHISEIGEYADQKTDLQSQLGKYQDLLSGLTAPDERLKETNLDRYNELLGDYNTKKGSYEAQITRIQDELGGIDEKMNILGAGKDYEDVTMPGAGLYASGSDLAILSSTRDRLERGKREYITDAQTAAYNLLTASENYDDQAVMTQKAADWDKASTFLGAVAGGLTFGKNMGWF